MPGEPKEPTGPQMPPTPDQAKRDLLSFEEFIAPNQYGHPKYNNFFAYFDRDPNGDFRSQPHYQRFEHENPVLATNLISKISNRDIRLGTAESLKPFERDLYEAYKILKSYGISDDDLFD